MNITRLPFFAALFALALSASIASAQATRTWVSGVGDDVNPGSRVAPCLTFAGAYGKTAVGGEINVLDSAGFGAISIAKALTIDGNGAHASILASGTTGVIVNAGTNDTVTLRNLSINGNSNGVYAVRVVQAGTVRIENCVLFNFGTNIVEFVPGNPNATLHIINTHIYQSGGGAGVSIRPTTTASVVIENCIIERCATGVHATGGTASLSETTVTANRGFGLLTSGGGSIKTFRNNRVFGNNPDGSFTGSMPLR